MVKMGYVWDRTVEFLGDHLSLLLPIVILGLFVPTSISGSLEEMRQSAGPGLKLGLGILTMVFAILSLWVQLAIVALAIDPAIGKRMTGVATARLLPAIGVLLVLLVVLGALCVPIGVLMVASGVDFTAMQAGQMAPGSISPGYAGMMALYGIVLGIAVLFVAARLLTLSAVIVAERRGLGAIRRSWQLTRGLTWRLVGVIVLYGVVSIVAVLAAQTVFGSILRIVAGGDGPLTVAGIITAIVVAAVSTGFSVLAAAFGGKLYVAILRATDAGVAPLPDSDPIRA